MRRRSAQLACLLLLIASLGAAESSARGEDFSLGGHYISMLLAQNTAAVRAETPLSRQLDDHASASPMAAVALASSVWTMRPPSAHSVRMQAVTGSGI